MSEQKRWNRWSAPLVALTLLTQGLLTQGLTSADPPTRDGIGIPVNPVRQSANPAGHIEVQDPMVKFADEIEVPAMESGRVAEVHVKFNDPVQADTPLARLDNRVLLIQRMVAQKRLKEAEKNANETGRIDFARVALEEAELEYESTSSIHRDARGAVPVVTVRRLEIAVKRARLDEELAIKEKEDAKFEAAVREADLTLIDEQLKNLNVESPIAGVVLDVAKSAGEWIDQGEPIATIARIDRLHVRGLVSSRDISPNLCRGLPVSVRWIDPADGVEHSLSGKVLSVDPQMMLGGHFRLHAEIINRRVNNDPTQWQLRPGVDVQMTVFKTAATAHRSNTTKR